MVADRCPERHTLLKNVHIFTEKKESLLREDMENNIQN